MVSNTFFQDFTIAENCGGEKAIRDTYKRAFKEWKSNTEMITEFVIALNHKIWAWYKQNEKIAKIYDELWKKADEWCKTHLKGEDLNYYYRETN